MRLLQLPAEIETAAQRYAALIIQARNRADALQDDRSASCDYHNVDIDSLELMRPRSVGAEHVSCGSITRLLML
jgi:hypothetical protein